MLRRCRMLMGMTVLLASLLLPFSAWAQSASAEGAPVRLRHSEGTVSVQRADAGAAQSAVVNLPLEAGDRLWTAEDGRAELLFEDGSTLWLDHGTTVDIVNLAGASSGPTTIVRLWSGSAYLARPDHEEARYGLSAFRVDAPAGSAVIGEAGLYRLDVDSEQRLWLSTYEGYAELVAGGAREGVAAGRQSYAAAGTVPARPVSFNTAEEDAFAAWRADRYAALYEVEHYTTVRSYVPRSIVHHTVELHGYGSWNYYPEFRTWGWYPRVSTGWSPFRHGRWIHTHRGWSWVPHHSWGWVTAHYGRWHFQAGHWVWFPGHRFSPAWVQWYVGAGHVGWVPLNFFNRPAVSFNVFIQNVQINDFHDFGHRGRGHLSVGSSAKGLAVGADGSARGGRVVDGLGYSSGTADAWTFVPADRLSADSVERVAVARTEAAKRLQDTSKALISGPLKPQQPTAAVPRRAAPRRADTPDPTGTTPGTTPRAATPRSGYRAGSGSVTRPGAATGPGTGGDATGRQAAPRTGGVEPVDPPRGPAARPADPIGPGSGQSGDRVDPRRAVPRGVEAPSRGDGRPVSPLSRRAIAPRRAPDSGAASPRVVPRAAPRSPRTPGLDGSDRNARRTLPRSDDGRLRSRAVPRGPARAPIGQGDSTRAVTPRRPDVRAPVRGTIPGSSASPRSGVRVRPRGGSSGLRALPRSGGNSRVSPPRNSRVSPPRTSRVSPPRTSRVSPPRTSVPRVVTPRSSSGSGLRSRPARSSARPRVAQPRTRSSRPKGTSGPTARPKSSAKPKAKAKPKGGGSGSES